MRDNHNPIKIVPIIAPALNTNSNAALVGAIVDKAGFESVEYDIQYGALTDANATSTVLLEESDAANMDGAAAVADDDLFGTEAACQVNAAVSQAARVCKLGYRGSKRYTRLTITPAGNDAGDMPLAATCILGHARHVSPAAGDTQIP